MFFKTRLQLIVSLLVWTLFAMACGKQPHRFPTTNGGRNGRGGSGSNASPAEIEKATSADSLKTFVLKMQKTDSLNFPMALVSVQRYLGYSTVNNIIDEPMANQQVRPFANDPKKPYIKHDRTNPNLSVGRNRQTRPTDTKTDKSTTIGGPVSHLDILLPSAGKGQQVTVNVVYSNKSTKEFVGTLTEEGISEIDAQDGSQKLSFACLNTDCGLQLVTIKTYGQDKGSATKKLSDLQAFVIAKITTSTSSLMGYYDLNQQAARLKMQVNDSKNNSVSFYSKKFSRDHADKIELDSDAGDYAELQSNIRGSKKSLTGKLTFDGASAVDLSFKDIKDYDFFVVPDDLSN